MKWENWPHATLSRFVDHRPHRWHLQVAGDGPVMLLLHGAGASTMSFRDLIPDLARDFRVIAVDLPGHGFTRMGTRQRQSLDHIARDLLSMLAAEGLAPDLAVGHSAGGAVALRLAELAPLRGVIGINAALSPFKGVAGWLFPMMAKALALSPFTALAVSMSTTDASLRALLRGTGSEIGPEGVALYRRLVSDAGHVDGTLAMMAQWKLDGLLARLPAIGTPTLLMAADRDRAVPPEVSAEAAARLPAATLLRLADLGHLAHEEAPADICQHIRTFASTLKAPTQTKGAAEVPAAP